MENRSEWEGQLRRISKEERINKIFLFSMVPDHVFETAGHVDPTGFPPKKMRSHQYRGLQLKHLLFTKILYLR